MAYLALTSVVVVLFLLSHKSLTYSSDFSQLIFSSDGRLLNASLAHDEQWRFYTDKDMPVQVKQALIAFEDKRFNDHWGVDMKAVARAVYQNITRRKTVSGASTITMQVVRLGRKGHARTLFEKLFEMVVALRLETIYSKDEILQQWAVHAPFGSNVVGVEAASWRYFGRSPYDLSWAEAALLAVLPNAPALIFPGRNHHLLVEKRNRLLLKLCDRGVIDHLTYKLALDEELPESFYPMPRELPHLSQHIERIEGPKPGNRYVVTVVPELQRKLSHIAQTFQSRYERGLVNNIAILVAETQTGNVLAYIGNAGNVNENGAQVDVIQSLRSTGSLLKPFLYATVLSDGVITPHELLIDLPVNYAGYSPRNFNGEYYGAVPASEALSRSLNIPMVRLLQQLGVGTLHRRLREIGMHSLNKESSHYGLSLILGGADATLFELTAMYAGMGRLLLDFPALSGEYNVANFHPLRLCSTYEKSDIYNEPPFSAGAVWHTLNAMQRLERPTEEGRWQQFSSARRIAWKTGTSYGFRDAWAIGIDPLYTVGVWVGNADGVPQNGLVGVHKAGPVLFEVFRTLPDASQWFPTPWDDLSEVEVCSASGKLAGDYCVHKKMQWIPSLSLRSGVCQWCRPVVVDAQLSKRYFQQCAPPNAKDTSWFVLPPSMEWYFRRYNSGYRPLPPLSEQCRQFTSDINPIDFVYPHAGSQLILPIDLTGQQNELVFQAVHRNPLALLSWYIDNEFVAQTERYHKIGIIPKVGQHTLLVEDLQGNRKYLKFEILEKNETSRSVQ